MHGQGFAEKKRDSLQNCKTINVLYEQQKFKVKTVK